jgi:hypothetical protein
VADSLLNNEVDQRFVALLVDGRDRLAGVTTSPVLGVTQLWQFTSQQE